MVDQRRDSGRRGEDVAETYLRTHRYAILARNWRSRAGEIDLVAERDGVVVFVEVRSRSSRRFGGPLESVDARKQLRLGRLAVEYLRSHRLQNRVARFDVIGIDWGAPDPKVVHVERAFDVGGPF